MFRRKKNDNEKGWVLVSAIVMILFLTGLGFAIASLVSEEYQHTRLEEYAQNAQLTAEAGIEQSVDELNSSDSFSGYSTPQTFFDNATQGKGVFTTTITDNSDGKSKSIISTGEVYLSDSATTPYAVRKVKVIVVGTASSGYSVLTGPGGLIISGSANVTNTNVYVGGQITMSGAAQIGTNNQPVTVDVGNNACPTGSNPGPTYPQVCTDGTQPINFSGSATIYGSVCATGQTSSSHIKTGNGGQGLEAGCTAPVATPPTYDRLSQINAVTTTASGSSNTYVCNSWPFNRNWPANLELTGNVSVGGSCNVTINGNAWITGNLTIGGASTITVADSVGTTRPIVMVDGTINVGGSASIVANSSGTGVEFISFASDNACTVGTTSGTYCSSLTGNDLKASQTEQNIIVGGNVKIPGVIFDAYWSEVVLGGSGNIGAATGQTVDLNGAGSVVFGTTLASNTTTWTISSYEPYSGP